MSTPIPASPIPLAAGAPSPARAPSRRIKAALVGEGIGPSLTPAMHEREGRAQGLDYSYVRIDTGDEASCGLTLKGIVDKAQADGFCGLNITHPHKTKVAALVDHLDGPAAILETVNTVVFRDGKKIGYTSDYVGFRRALASRIGSVQGHKVLQLGAGGAGSAVGLGLTDEGVSSLHIVDIEEDCARALAERLACARPGARVIASGGTSGLDLGSFDGAVNCTPLGMKNHPGMAIDPAGLSSAAWVADIVYFPLETALIMAARRHGCRVMDGGAMALFQAIEAFALMTGRTPNAKRMSDTFKTLLREREVGEHRAEIWPDQDAV